MTDPFLPPRTPVNENESCTAIPRADSSEIIEFSTSKLNS